MLLPIGHEESSVRRLPWVCFSIMGLCVLSWLLCLTVPDTAALISNRERTALSYYFDHPYLHLDEELKKFRYFQMRQTQEGDAPQVPTDRQLIAEEQSELDQLSADYFDARDQVPERRWGLVPADVHVYAIITHMFMHAGFLHLLGNMFILYLTGPYIEDVWGRGLFAVFYLAAGAVAVLGFVLKYPSIDEPLIGASGAVAGVMGAFMVRYAHTKIIFFYTLGVRRWTGTFAAPAWLMLSFWLGNEILLSQGWWSASPAGVGSIAYWAHVTGFGFGVVVALVIARLRLEERWVSSRLERRQTVLDHSFVDEAMELAHRGDVDAAMQRLLTELRANPDNEQACAALWRIAVAGGRSAEVAPRIQPFIRRAARDGEIEDVRVYWLLRL